MTWLREPPYSLCYDHLPERVSEIQGNDLGQRKNAKDWEIRRREPTADWIGHGSFSETAKALVSDEGLIHPRMLKVQSMPHRKMREDHGVVNCCAHFSPSSKDGYGMRVYATKCHSTICGKFAYRLD